MVAPNASFSQPSYVAILKAKQGELLAVQTTPRENFIPLLEVIDPSKSAGIGRIWPHSDHVAWLQPIRLDGTDDQGWVDVVTGMFNGLRAIGSLVAPVVTLDDRPEIYQAIREVVATDQRGMVLRLDCEDALEETPDDLLAAVDELLGACDVVPADCDLVLDAGLVDGAAAVQSGAVSSALAALPHVTSWRNVVAAFSGFPNMVGDHVPPSSVVPVPRTDAAAFNQLSARWGQTQLTFGDYAVGVPTYTDVKWSPIPNIRYAVRGEWIIHRAATRLNPSPQYIQLARDVAASTYFAGPTASPGDRYINDVATGVDGPGNAGSYLRAAMSRHFHVVLESLAIHGAP